MTSKWSQRTSIEKMLGETFVTIQRNKRDGRIGEDSVVFTTKNKEFRMFHEQDCCEGCDLEDVCGDLDDLKGHPILLAEEVTNRKDPPPGSATEGGWAVDSYTWTYYKLATIKGTVTFRWYGESNGYYSEEADITVQDLEEQRE